MSQEQFRQSQQKHFTFYSPPKIDENNLLDQNDPNTQNFHKKEILMNDLDQQIYNSVEDSSAKIPSYYQQGMLEGKIINTNVSDDKLSGSAKDNETNKSKKYEDASQQLLDKTLKKKNLTTQDNDFFKINNNHQDHLPKQYSEAQPSKLSERIPVDQFTGKKFIKENYLEDTQAQDEVYYSQIFSSLTQPPKIQTQFKSQEFHLFSCPNISTNELSSLAFNKNSSEQVSDPIKKNTRISPQRLNQTQKVNFDMIDMMASAPRLNFIPDYISYSESKSEIEKEELPSSFQNPLKHRMLAYSAAPLIGQQTFQQNSLSKKAISSQNKELNGQENDTFQKATKDNNKEQILKQQSIITENHNIYQQNLNQQSNYGDFSHYSNSYESKKLSSEKCKYKSETIIQKSQDEELTQNEGNNYGQASNAQQLEILLKEYKYQNANGKKEQKKENRVTQSKNENEQNNIKKNYSYSQSQKATIELPQNVNQTYSSSVEENKNLRNLQQETIKEKKNQIIEVNPIEIKQTQKGAMIEKQISDSTQKEYSNGINDQVEKQKELEKKQKFNLNVKTSKKENASEQNNYGSEINSPFDLFQKKLLHVKTQEQHSYDDQNQIPSVLPVSFQTPSSFIQPSQQETQKQNINNKSLPINFNTLNSTQEKNIAVIPLKQANDVMKREQDGKEEKNHILPYVKLPSHDSMLLSELMSPKKLEIKQDPQQNAEKQKNNLDKESPKQAQDTKNIELTQLNLAKNEKSKKQGTKGKGTEAPEEVKKRISELNKWMNLDFQIFIKKNFSKQQKKQLIEQLSKQIETDHEDSQLECSNQEFSSSKLECDSVISKKSNKLTETPVSPFQNPLINELKSEKNQLDYIKHCIQCQEQFGNQKNLLKDENELKIRNESKANQSPMKNENFSSDTSKSNSFGENKEMAQESKLLLKDIYDEVQNALSKYDYIIQETQKNKSIHEGSKDIISKNQSFNIATLNGIQTALSQLPSNSELMETAPVNLVNLRRSNSAKSGLERKCSSHQQNSYQESSPAYKGQEKSISIQIDPFEGKISKMDEDEAEQAFNNRKNEILKSLQSSKLRKNFQINQKPMNHSQSKIPINTPIHIRTPSNCQSNLNNLAGFSSHLSDYPLLNSSLGCSQKQKSQSLLNKVLSPKRSMTFKKQESFKISHRELNSANIILEDGQQSWNEYQKDENKATTKVQEHFSPSSYSINRDSKKKKTIQGQQNNSNSNRMLSSSTNQRRAEPTLKDLAKSTNSPVLDDSYDQNQNNYSSSPPINHQEKKNISLSKLKLSSTSKQSQEIKRLNGQKANTVFQINLDTKEGKEVRLGKNDSTDFSKIMRQSIQKQIRNEEIDQILVNEFKDLELQIAQSSQEPELNKEMFLNSSKKEIKIIGESNLQEIEENLLLQLKQTKSKEIDSFEYLIDSQESQKISQEKIKDDQNQNGQIFSLFENDRLEFNVYKQKKLAILSDIEDLNRQIEEENKKDLNDAPMISPKRQKNNFSNGISLSPKRPAANSSNLKFQNSIKNDQAKKDIAISERKNKLQSNDINRGDYNEFQKIDSDEQEVQLNLYKAHLVSEIPQTQSLTQIEQNNDKSKPKKALPKNKIIEKNEKSNRVKSLHLTTSPRGNRVFKERSSSKNKKKTTTQEDEGNEQKQEINLYREEPVNEANNQQRGESANFLDRNQKWLQSKKNKMEKTSQNHNSEEMKECTFKPLTNKYHNPTKPKPFTTPENKRISKTPPKKIPPLKQPLPNTLAQISQQKKTNKNTHSTSTSKKETEEINKMQQQGVQSPIVQRYSEVEFWSQSDASVFRVINDLDASYQQELKKEINEVLDIIQGLSSPQKPLSKTTLLKNKKKLK